VITLETVVGFALREPTVMDQLGPALRNDLVVANTFYRRLAEFADDFLLAHRHLPGSGDWEMWLESLDAGMVRDGTKEALGRLQAVDVSAFEPAFFCTQAIELLQKGAAKVARARLNELADVEPATFAALAEKVASVKGGGLQGLAHLDEIDRWAKAPREDDLISTGYPTLDQLVGGWGKELWIIFADSGIGKSMLLQNFATNAAVRGKRVLHITLELGLGPQIRRYYRQIAQVGQNDFHGHESEIKKKLQHWFRLASGEILLLEFPAYSLNTEDLRRTIERVIRTSGPVHMLILDYLDLLGVVKGNRNAYEDLGRITHEVRGLSQQFDLSVLTASQSVRRPEKKGSLTVRDMGDSYNKVRGADGLLALNQTDEEEEVHQGRLGVLKVRDSGGRGRQIGLYVNRELALIQELNHPNTRQLMERLGHIPGVKTPTPPPTPAGGLV